MGFLKYIFNWSSNAVSTTRTLFVSILPSIQLITNSNTITTASSFSLAEKDIQKLLQHRKMTKTSPFKAYDIHRKRSHTITSPRPAKINSHRLNRQDWAVSKDSTREAKTRRAKSKAAAKRTPKSILDVLKYDRSDWHCRECGKTGDDPDCDSRCYKKFKQEKFLLEDAIDIRGPGKLGYGAFPGTNLKKGHYLGEYLGVLKPLDRDDGNDPSLYCVAVQGVCVIDAESAGNWTRFVNSSCQPNVNARWDVIGKRHVIVLQAREDIGPEEELTFNYGSRYFEHAGLKCDCGVKRGKHVPASPGSRRSSPKRK